MKCVISAHNVKTFAKSVLALSKTGDEIYVEPLQDSLTLRTVNSSKSAFVFFEFKKTFFTVFEPDLSKKSRLNNTTLNNTTLGDQSYLNQNNDESLISEAEPFKCKIPSRCLLSIFKNVNLLEKTVEKCTITVKYIPLSREITVYDYDTTMITKRLNKNNEEQLFDIKFLIVMNCKYGMRKTFIISISDCENLQAAFSADKCSNKLSIGSKYLNETINCFNNDTEEISLIIKPDQLFIKNYVQTETGSDVKSVNTQVNFDSDEFSNYDIEKETDITFGLKEFKICLQFGIYFDITLDIFFQRKGRPVIFCYNGNSTYKASFTLATLSEDLNPSQCTSISTNNPNQTTDISMIFNNSRLMNDSSIMNSTRQQYTKSGTVLDKINKNKSTTVSAITISNIPNKDLNSPATKGNKRTLFDTSNNQSYLPVLDNNNNKNNDDDDDDDDALLTQALNEQESKTNDSQTPPAKKPRSLVQSLFDDDEDDQDITLHLDEDSSQSVTRNVKRFSFAALLESQDSEEVIVCEKENIDKKSNTIYIDETSSEEEDS